VERNRGSGIRKPLKGDKTKEKNKGPECIYKTGEIDEANGRGGEGVASGGDPEARKKVPPHLAKRETGSGP